MNSQQIELLRAAILRVLDANHSSFGLSAEAVGAFLPAQGFAVSISETQTHLDWLVDNRFAVCPTKALNPDAKFYRITAAGRDLL
jgi:hypothetical protein